MNFDSYINEPLPFSGQIGKYFSRNAPLIIFEIGSCEGEDSIRLKKRFPNSTVYTFEPLPGNIELIKANFKRYGLPVNSLYQLALSNKSGTSKFYVSSGHPDHLPKEEDWDYGNKSSSLLPPKEHTKILKWIKFKDKIQVKTKRLEEFCNEHGIPKIDFVYMDVQGAELMVLEGAGEMLKNIGAIWMEVEAIELYKGQPLKNNVEKFMTSNGFVRIIDTVDEISGDQLYIQKNFIKNISLLSRMRARLETLLGGGA